MNADLTLIARAYGRALIAADHRLIMALAGLDEASWTEFRRRRQEPMVLLAITAGAVDPAGDGEPSSPVAIELAATALLLGAAAAFNDFSVLRQVVATASLPDRSRLAVALLQDARIRGTFLYGFAQANGSL